MSNSDLSVARIAIHKKLLYPCGIKLRDVIRILIELPEDIQIVGLQPDYSNMNDHILIRHSALPKIKEGCIIPTMDIRVYEDKTEFWLENERFTGWNK